MPSLKEIAKKNTKFKKKEYRPYDLTGEGDSKPERNNPVEPSIDEREVCLEVKKETGDTQSQEERLDVIPSRGVIMEVSPNECRPWDFADRSELEMGDISELAKSIKANGQQEPVLIRKLKRPDGDVKYEVIFGHRRWKACLLCHKPLFAIVKDISDKDAAVAQKEENQNRENLSDYSRAFNYKKLLDSKVFKTQTELAAHLGIPQNSLAVLLNYTKIPSELLQAMKAPHTLPQRTATKIAQLTTNITPEQLAKLCKIAPGFVNGTISYKNITAALFSDDPLLTTTSTDSEVYERKIIKNKLGVRLFSTGLNQNKVPSITFQPIIIENNLYNDVVDLVANFLKEKTEKS